LWIGDVDMVWVVDLGEIVYMVYMGIFDVKIDRFRVYPLFN